MLATYASALIVVGSALLVGQAVLVACGWRRWSWLAPVVGLGPILALAWGAVQLPGEGLTALAAVALASAAALTILIGHLDGVGEAVREGLPAALITLAAASIPFVVEGRFGVLGTGFNVDMSQHLFAADWLADPTGSKPGLVLQGYPLGPHGLAAAAPEAVGGDLVRGFSGLTIAVPVIAALSALTVLRGLSSARRAAGAVLVALPYAVASYLAQGQFKELLQGLFVLGFALTLHELARGWATGGPPRRRALAAIPLAAIALGSLYAYSAPGLAWLGGTAVLFAGVELFRRREGALDVVRRAAVPVIVGLVVAIGGAAPELGRVADFQGNAVDVADAGDREPAAAGRPDQPEATGSPTDGRRTPGESSDRGERPRFNNDLGNLFDDISPLEALGIWPSGDFRVEPGDGAVPAIVFWTGTALAAVALLFALRRWISRGETAVPAALVAAVAVYIAAWAVSTPYATAKAVMMIAPLATLVTVRDLLAPDVLTLDRRPQRGLLALGLAIAFLLGAGGSSLLALGNAPVGPEDYSPGLARMRSIFEGRPTLVLADPGGLEGEHGREFLGWEARGGDPLCIEPIGALSSGSALDGIEYVVTTEGETEPPVAGASLVRRDGPYAVWEARHAGRRGGALAGAPGDPTECRLAGASGQ